MRAFEVEGVLHERVAGTALLVLSGFVLIGWIAGIPALTTWGAPSVSTSPLAAIGFAIAGTCLVGSCGDRRQFGIVCGVLVIALGIVDVLPAILNFGSAKNSLLARWADRSLASEMTSLGLTMSGVALAIQARNSTLARGLGALVVLLGILALLDLILTLGDRHLPGFTSVALPTAIGFLLLGAGLVLNADGRLLEVPMKAVLGALVFAALLPAFVFMMAQSRRLSEQQFETVKLSSSNSAEDIKSLIDTRLAERVALLRGLATTLSVSPQDTDTRQPDLARFHAQAVAAVGEIGGWIILTDSEGRQLANSHRPASDMAGPQLTLPTISRAALQGQPMISDLQQPRNGSKGPLVTVSYPIAERGLVLSWQVPVSKLSEVLERVAPAGWIYGVIDRAGAVVARSKDAAHMIGRFASEPFRTRFVEEPSGSMRSTTLDGIAVFSSWRRLDNGWTAVAAVDEASIDIPGREQLRSLVIGATLMTILGLSFATFGAILISRPLLRFSALSGNDGAVVGARASHFSIVREINALATALIDAARDRRRASEALTESEARLKRFVDQAPAAIAMFDRDMRYLAASRRWHAYFAPEDGDLVGRHHYDVFPNISPEWKAFHQRGLAGEVLEADNDPFVGWDGQTRYIRWELRPWRAVDDAIGGITIFSEDVTERAVAERALRESEIRQKAIVDTATDAIVVIDANGIIESVNGSAEKMFGYRAAEAIGKNVRLLMGDDDRNRHDDYVKSYVETGKAKIIGFGREVIGRRKDGSLLPIDLSIAEWTIDGRRRFTGIMRDITSRKEREAHVRLVMRELSHRTKNALAVVQAMAWQTSQSSQSLDEFQQQFGQRVEGLSRSIGLLVRSEWEGVAVRDLVEGQLAPFLDDAASRLVCAGPVLNLKPNAAQDLGLVLHELATNASKYGALSVPGGRVETTWTSRVIDGTKRFQFDWRETGGPLVDPPSRSGFGSVLIKDLLARTYGAEIDMMFASDGFCWRFVVDESRMIA